MKVYIFILFLGYFAQSLGHSVIVDCETELNNIGQYLCITSTQIDPKTQQIKGCTKENVAKSKFPEHELPLGFLLICPLILSVWCTTPEDIICSSTKTNSFQKEVPCKWT